jgi:hypothetical protein
VPGSVERSEAEIAAQHVRLGYLRQTAALWDARDRTPTRSLPDCLIREPNASTSSRTP